MLVSNLKALFTFPFCIGCLNLEQIFSMFIVVTLGFIYLFIFFFVVVVLLSSKSLRTFPSSHNSKRLSSALRWPFTFKYLLSFCRSKPGCIPFAATFFNSDSLNHKFISLSISFITLLPAGPDGNIISSFANKQSVRMLRQDLSEKHFSESCWNKRFLDFLVCSIY